MIYSRGFQTVVRVPLGVRQASLRGTRTISKIKIFFKFMNFMSIFLSLAILRPPFAYFSVHFYEFMPSDVGLVAGWYFSPGKRSICFYGGLKNEINKDMLCDFWLKRRAEYGLISDRALHFLIPFSTSYLCETGFQLCLRSKTNTE